MADKVVLKANEINSLSSKLAEFHSSQMTYIKSVVNVARVVGTNKDIFETASMADSIGSLLDLLESDIMGLLENSFAMSERAIDIEIQSMQGYDQ